MEKDQIVFPGEGLSDASGKLEWIGGIGLIIKERLEQINKHGFGNEHDAQYVKGELEQAAMFCINQNWDYYPQTWDRFWGEKILDKRPTERLAIAGAFLAAEIDRRLLVAQEHNALGEYQPTGSPLPKPISLDATADRTIGNHSALQKTWEYTTYNFSIEGNFLHICTLVWDGITYKASIFGRFGFTPEPKLRMEDAIFETLKYLGMPEAEAINLTVDLTRKFLKLGEANGIGNFTKVNT